MNRAIEFRAYDKGNREMLEVQKLDFEPIFYGGNLQIRTTEYSDYFDFNELELMEYTGLKDINGIKIFEGDIVEETGHYVNSDRKVYQKIQWKENHSCWLRGEYQRLTPKNVKEYKIRVVGNIYDNKNLLEE